MVKQLPATGPAMAVMDYLLRYGSADLDEIATQTRLDKRVARQAALNLIQKGFVQRTGG